MGAPQANIEFEVSQVRELLQTQHPELGHLPLCLTASGWDNAVYRLGPELALRLPRRALAAKLIENEQRWLPTLQQQLPLPVPAAVRIGVPQAWYPWHWSVIPWFDGETADVAMPDRTQGAALAGFFKALHVAPPAEAPRNAFRGVPLCQRAAKFQECLDSLAAKESPLDPRLLDIWHAALDAPMDMPDTWIHGDLHPRNVLTSDGRIVAVIDWGDIAAGDRARGWALLLAVILLDAGYSGDPRMGIIARRALERLLTGP